MRSSRTVSGFFAGWGWGEWGEGKGVEGGLWWGSGVEDVKKWLCVVLLADVYSKGIQVVMCRLSIMKSICVIPGAGV